MLGWGYDRWLRLRATNEMIVANYLTRTVNSKRGASVEKPNLMPAPGSKQKTATGIPGTAKAIIAGIKAARAEGVAADRTPPQ